MDNLDFMNIRQTYAEADQNPELHAPSHLQAPYKLEREGNNGEVDQHGKSLDRNPPV